MDFDMTNVLKQQISFEVSNDKIIGDLYLPAEATSTLPAVAVTGPMTSVKEQVQVFMQKPSLNLVMRLWLLILGIMVKARDNRDNTNTMNTRLKISVRR
ncbi:MAG: hypothetical protein ACI9ZT_000055 [Gammaproteobacteria bacterium]